MKIFKKLYSSLLLIIILFSFSYVFAENVDVPNIYSPSAILIDASSGKVLYEKNVHEKKYIASLTKVMTAIIILENCNLDDIATVSYEATTNLPSGYVTANLQVGESFTVEQLLYILMVPSSNDASIVLAEHLSGSIDAFCSLMNQKAIELGCTNTNFTNPSGEHNPDHYSSAYDLALITKYAMQNEFFRTLVSTTSYSLPATDKYKSNDRLFTTTNELIVMNNNNRSDNYYYKYAIGVKTGFTTPSGYCLIGAAKREKLELISVVLGAGQTNEGLSAKNIDTINLFNYGYDVYTTKEIAKKNSIVQTINVAKATKDTKKLDLVLENDITVLIKKEDLDAGVLPQIKINENLKAPISKGNVVGTISYTVEGITYNSNLLASHDVCKSRWLLKIITILFILIIGVIYLKLKKKLKKSRKRKS